MTSASARFGARSTQGDERRKALIVVDMQNDYCHEDGVARRQGRPPLAGYSEFVGNCARLIAEARKRAGVLVLYTLMSTSDGDVEVPDAWAEHRRRKALERICLDGTWGQQVIDQLKPQPADVVLKKSRFSAFHETSLDAVLRGYGVGQCVLTGITTYGCVDMTLRDALQHGYFIRAVRDAVGAFDQDLHTRTIDKWDRSYGGVCRTEELIALWRHQTDSYDFMPN